MVARSVSSTTEQAQQRLGRSTAGIWLVQCNPRTTDILDSSRAALPDAWCVKRHTKDIRRGDRIVLWLTGAHAGVYALGLVTADVLPATAAAGGDGGPSPVLKVSVDLFLDLFERPVRRTVLKEDRRFADESVIRQPFAANPHRVSPPAFDAILERVAHSG